MSGMLVMTGLTVSLPKSIVFPRDFESAISLDMFVLDLQIWTDLLHLRIFQKLQATSPLRWTLVGHSGPTQPGISPGPVENKLPKYAQGRWYDMAVISHKNHGQECKGILRLFDLTSYISPRNLEAKYIMIPELPMDMKVMLFGWNHLVSKIHPTWPAKKQCKKCSPPFWLLKHLLRLSVLLSLGQGLISKEAPEECGVFWRYVFFSGITCVPWIEMIDIVRIDPLPSNRGNLRFIAIPHKTCNNQ